MIYLYAGLGIAMISGISAMMQIGNILNNMSPLSALKQDSYEGKIPYYDRQIMKTLYTQSVPDNDICLCGFFFTLVPSFQYLLSQKLQQ